MVEYEGHEGGNSGHDAVAAWAGIGILEAEADHPYQRPMVCAVPTHEWTSAVTLVVFLVFCLGCFVWGVY